MPPPRRRPDRLRAHAVRRCRAQPRHHGQRPGCVRRPRDARHGRLDPRLREEPRLGAGRRPGHLANRHVRQVREDRRRHRRLLQHGRTERVHLEFPHHRARAGQERRGGRVVVLQDGWRGRQSRRHHPARRPVRLQPLGPGGSGPAGI
ncbi:PPR repeat [Musa troglodytarum]|uniref:PPR repeat n=1 Tax=Musa troglodytarum TaxID=320322 RepID=A0A9E7KXS9_9LILI|nr:PPR repeat [Musa troglodytarum]